MSPVTAAESMIPAAKEIIMFEDLGEVSEQEADKRAYDGCAADADCR